MAADRAPADRAPGAQPVPPFHVRQLTIEDGLTLAASPQPGAWQVYDALEPFPPDEGYWAVADSQDSLLGFCCLGEPARAPGGTGHPAVLDIAIGIRSDLSGQGWGAELGRAAVAYARSVALDRRLRTTVPDWNTVGLHVAEQSGFVRSGTTWIGGRQYVILDQPTAGLVPRPAQLTYHHRPAFTQNSKPGKSLESSTWAIFNLGRRGAWATRAARSPAWI